MRESFSKMRSKRIKLNITGLAYLIKECRDPVSLYNLAVRSYQEVNQGDYPQEHEIEQIIDVFNTIREAAHKKKLWVN
jgi:hypothetical protein